jgi:hypothetical protein
MKLLFDFSQFKFNRKLKKLAIESAALGEPLKVLEDIVFKAMLGSDTEDSNEARKSTAKPCLRNTVSAA